MLAYPVELTQDTNGTLMVAFPDFSEAATFGEDEADALLRAVDALETVLAARIDDREPWQGPQVDRLLDLGHASRLDQIEQALAAPGKRLTLDVADAA